MCEGEHNKLFLKDKYLFIKLLSSLILRTESNEGEVKCPDRTPAFNCMTKRALIKSPMSKVISTMGFSIPIFLPISSLTNFLTNFLINFLVNSLILTCMSILTNIPIRTTTRMGGWILP
jgi:hypothetical protein